MPFHHWLSPRSRVCCSLTLLLGLAACSSRIDSESPDALSSALTTRGLFFQGDNLSGAERGFGAAIEEKWGPALPGVEGETYSWPTPAERPLPSGMNIVRLPFQWERLQPALNADFDAAYLAKLHATANAWRDLGANVLLDVHNYAYYKLNGRGTEAEGQHIGSEEVPVAAFVDLWRRLALEFGSGSTSAPFIFGLMNEPHDIKVPVWIDAAQKAVDAIRATGAKNTILVPGADWTTANDFSWSQNRELLQTVKDPLENFAIEVHQYYDGVCTPTGYVEKLKPFEDWARANHRSAYLGEIDVHETDACHEAFANLIDHLHATAADSAEGVWIGYSYWEGLNVTKGLPHIQPHLPATCASGSKDGAETDQDCGATCLRCRNGQSCEHDYDCQSGFCAAGMCSAMQGGAGASASAGASGATGASGTAGASGAGGSGAGTIAGSGGMAASSSLGGNGGGSSGSRPSNGGASIAGSSSADDGTPARDDAAGCSCRSAPGGTASWSPLALAALLGLAQRRRRGKVSGSNAARRLDPAGTNAT